MTNLHQNRAQHFLRAEQLQRDAIELLDAAEYRPTPELADADRQHAVALLAAALVSATLTAAGPGVDGDVEDERKRRAAMSARAHPDPWPPVTYSVPVVGARGIENIEADDDAPHPSDGPGQ